MTIGHTAAQFLARSRDETRCLVHTPIPVVLLLLFFFFAVLAEPATCEQNGFHPAEPYLSEREQALLFLF